MKPGRNHIVLYLFVLLQATGCLDEIDLDLGTGSSNLVVFGWITNEVKPYEIKLTLSNGFSNQSAYQAITAAEVYVLDQREVRYDFVENGSTGHYYSNPNQFVGSPGDTYQLKINVNGNSYESSLEPLHSLPQAEAAFINFIADTLLFEVAATDPNFFISAYINDDPTEHNYYRWKVYVNNTLRNKPEELVLFDDRFTNGNRFKFDAANVLFTATDLIYFEHMSMSKSSYEYYTNLKEQTTNSTFSPRIQPGIIRGNIKNMKNPDELILGYFGASEVTAIAIGD